RHHRPGHLRDPDDGGSARRGAGVPRQIRAPSGAAGQTDRIRPARRIDRGEPDAQRGDDPPRRRDPHGSEMIGDDPDEPPRPKTATQTCSMTSSSRTLERQRALQARIGSAKRLLVTAFVCIGLGVLVGAVMAPLSIMMQISPVSVLYGPIALLSFPAFAVLLRREALAPRKTGILGRCGIFGL